MPRSLTITANTKLTPRDHEALREKAASCRMSISTYLRLLVMEDLTVKTSMLLQTVEAEHARLMILTAQRGQELTQQVLRNLRNEAVVTAPTTLENTLRLLKQQHDANELSEAEAG